MFTPAFTQLFIREFLLAIYKKAVIANLANRQYQGQAQLNGTVNVLTLSSSITVSDYDLKSDLTFEDVATAYSSMAINQAKAFGFQVDKKTLTQITPQVVMQYAQQAANKMALALDANLYAHQADVLADNVMGTSGAPIALTKDNVVDTFLKLEEKMDINGVDDANRWLVVSNEIGTMLKIAGFNKTMFVGGAGTSAMATGEVMKVGGFTVYESNTIRPVAGVHSLLAGDAEFINLAMTVDEVQTFQPEKNFNTALKGLMVFGSKVFQPERGGLILASVA
jgi:hypothetical protein